DLLTNLSLVGPYTMTGTVTATTTLTETGSARRTLARDYQVIQDGTVTQSATLGSLAQHQTVHAQSTHAVTQGTIDMSTGEFSQTLTSHTTDTILGQDALNQSRMTTLTGAATVDTTVVKTGKELLG